MDDAGWAPSPSARATMRRCSPLADLAPGFLFFEEHRDLPRVSVDRKTGAYELSAPERPSAAATPLSNTRRAARV